MRRNSFQTSLRLESAGFVSEYLKFAAAKLLFTLQVVYQRVKGEMRFHEFLSCLNNEFIVYITNKWVNRRFFDLKKNVSKGYITIKFNFQSFLWWFSFVCMRGKKLLQLLFLFFLFLLLVIVFGRTDGFFFYIWRIAVVGTCDQYPQAHWKKSMWQIFNYRKFRVWKHYMPCSLEKIIMAEVSGHIQSLISNENVTPHLRYLHN